ncbi:hypothetical protein [Halegenticoccus tardaugens]|uniref:hypothetical protein n=1 Tax=Halegenticoccus tardaugens TaxID=2071624 RepID=UPI001E3009A1|nr:hypothetical protein [Halegenticoccus tardaugens]
MSKKRYKHECVDGTLVLVAGDDRVEVRTVDDVVAAVGGETYTIEYDERQRTQPCLEIDDGTLEVDVRETATTLSHTEETVSELRAATDDATAGGYWIDISSPISAAS